MAPPSGTIDLGELPPGDSAPPELHSPWPIRARLRRWHGRRTGQLVGAAAVTALTVIAVTAAATPPRPAVSRQFTIEAMAIAYDEQTLYLLERPAAGIRQTTVTAHRLADRGVRWQTSLPSTDGSWLILWDGVLLVISVPIDGRDGAGGQTTRLDPDTGEPLWTNVGWPVQVAGDRVVLEHELAVEQEPDEQFEETAPPRELTVVDLATGEPAWTVVVAGWNYDAGTEATNLVTLDEAGELASYDLATGELLATATIASTEDLLPYYASLRVIGSLALVTDRPGAHEEVVAYDTATLTPRWTVAGPSDIEDRSVWPTPCGTLICLSGSDYPPRALDPATGEQVWSVDWLSTRDDPGWFEVTELGTGHPERPADHLVLTFVQESADGQTEDRTSWLVEAGTGAPVLDLAGWTLASSYWAPPVATPAPMLVQHDGSTSWVGRLRPDLSGLDVLGAIAMDAPDGPELSGAQCDAHGDHVVCVAFPMTDGRDMQVEVWQVHA